MSKKYVLITGATKGIGEALAKSLVHSGFNLCLVARNEILLRELSTKLSSETNQQIIPFVCDLADPESVEVLISAVKTHLPSLDALINNAAIHGPIGSSWENDWNLWQQVIQVNLLAPVVLCRAFVPLMQKSKGSIVNFSGGGATGPRANFSAYATAKTGLVRFSETLADEVKAFGIRVNCVAPGAMKTALLSEVIDKGAEIAGQREYELAEKVFTKGGADMNRVTDLVHFLISGKGSGITGKLISAVWDKWENWPAHLDELKNSDAYTLRRIAGRDRGFDWGDV
jgi:NAD(P)-dependent dehydrogenase (short-subunit alcohol dehydrogenase family)